MAKFVVARNQLPQSGAPVPSTLAASLSCPADTSSVACLVLKALGEQEIIREKS